MKEIFSKHWLSRICEFRMPPNVLFGFDATEKCGEMATQISLNRDAIVITDKFLVESGLVDQVLNSLELNNFTVEVYATEVAEPSIKQVKKVINEASKKDFGIVVGVGGGSSLDRAKIAACFGGTSDHFQDYLAPSNKLLTHSKPKLLLPTTSGTGSEASNTAVVTTAEGYIGSAKTWVTGDKVRAEAVIVDPALTIGLPPKTTASTGMDALSHCAEGVISKQANPLSDALALQGVKLVFENLRTAYQEGEDLEARWNMAMAAMLGGVVISFPGVAGPATLGHAASEGISPKYSMPHGAACGVLLPYVFWFNLSSAYGQKKLAIMAELMGIETNKMSEARSAELTIRKTFDLLEDLEIPSDLKNFGMKEEDIPVVAKYILERSETMYSMSAFNPRKASIGNLEEFFYVAYEGRECLEKLISKRNRR